MQIPIRQLRGAKDLIQDAVIAGTDAAERMQLAVTRHPYAVLEKIPPVAAPARVVEAIQRTITVGIYAAIRSATHWSAKLADHALNLADKANQG